MEEETQAPVITGDYYAPENDHLMSNSQWGDWLKCPSMAHARWVSHEHPPKKPTEAMAVGALADALLLDPDDVPRVMREHGHLLLSKQKGKEGTELACCRRAHALVEYIRSKPQIMAIVDACTKQETIVFRVGSMWWKCRIDLTSHELFFIWDMKKCADVWAEEWCQRLGCRADFIAVREYRRQLALYREAVRQKYGRLYRVGIFAVGDTEPPDLALRPWATDQYHQIDDAMCSVLEMVETVDGWRHETNPGNLQRCERCEWCRMSRTDFIFPYSEPMSRKERYS